MKQSGEYRIDAEPETVWRTLNDAETLVRCIEGCRSMTRTALGRFTAQIDAHVGPLSAPFAVELTLSDVEPPKSFTLQAAVKGVAGFGDGSAKVSLTEEGASTLLRYDIVGSVGGMLAQVGDRLIDTTGRRMADGFFRNLGDVIAAVPARAAEPAARRDQRKRLMYLAILGGATGVACGLALTLTLTQCAGPH
jgi:carbon monoxide dehydrogenase subunit G